MFTLTSGAQIGDSAVVVRYLTRTFFAEDGSRVGPLTPLPDGGPDLPLLKPTAFLGPDEAAQCVATRHMIEDYTYPAALMYT